MKTPKYNQHVVPRGSSWAIRREGTDKATATFHSREVAISMARDIAKNQGTKLIIHGINGKVFRIESFEKKENENNQQQ